MQKHDYKSYVYILASASGTLYIGMTNNLYRRVQEHKEKKVEGFTKKYSCNELVFYERFKYIHNAIEREKQIKKWNRTKKESLIKDMNPHWEDLFTKLYID